MGADAERRRAPAEDVADGTTSTGAVAMEGPSHMGDAELERELTDAPRAFRTLTLEPRRRWLAATDTLGRVLLLESRSLVMVRVWKGYRDAQCGWTEAAAVGCVGDGTLAGDDGCAGRPSASLLVVYAPRRELLEIWPVPRGGRVCACTVGPDCLLLSPVPNLDHAEAGAGADDENRLALWADGRPRCLVLQTNGVLNLVSVRPTATLSGPRTRSP